jgi:Ribbon-helix-helix protein, copG family
VDRAGKQSDTLLLVTDSGAPMLKANRPTSTERTQAYRQRLREAGGEEVLFKLPSATVALLDELKRRQGLRNRSQALLQLIDRGGQPPSR